MRSIILVICAAAAFVGCGADTAVTSGGMQALATEQPVPEQGPVQTKEFALSSATCYSTADCADDWSQYKWDHDISDQCTDEDTYWCSNNRCWGYLVTDLVCENSSSGCTSDYQCGSGYRCIASTCSYYGSGSCNDGDACTYNDHYDGNWSCVGTRYTCDDGVSCNTDSCYTSGGSAYCTHSSTSYCNDYDSCTTDTCTTGGSCQHTQISNCCTSSNQCGSGYYCSSNQCVWSGYNGGGNNGGGSSTSIVYVDVTAAPSFGLWKADFYGQFCTSVTVSGTQIYCYGASKTWDAFNASYWTYSTQSNSKTVRFQLSVPSSAMNSTSGMLIGSVTFTGNRSGWYPESPSGSSDITVRFSNSSGTTLQQYITPTSSGQVVRVSLR